MTVDGTGFHGFPEIASRDLRPEHVPAAGRPFWPDVSAFALTFDGYQHRADLGDWANRHVRRFADIGALGKGLNLDDLRALLFFEQRRWRHLDIDPDPAARVYVDALLDAIRAEAAVGR